MNKILGIICRHVAAFGRSDGGNIAIIFGISLIPVIGLTGAAIDYTRASAARAAMQSALDATALAMSKEASSLTDTALNDRAKSYFNAAFHRPDVHDVKVSAVYSNEGGFSVTVTGDGSLPTSIMGVMGINEMSINSSSMTAWGTSRLRVALVLDNTGSMANDGKMNALKKASHDLLKMFKSGAKTPGDIQVAIVPFNTYVKVDPAVYKDKPWIDWSVGGGGGGAGKDKDDDDDHKGSGCNGGKDDDKDKDKDPCKPDKNAWNGCFTDRTQPYDIQNTTPSVGNKNTWFPAVNCTMATIMSLSNDWTALNNKIDAMVPAGNTNQPIGLIWGWHAMTSADPLNAAALPAGTRPVIILLTDGMNTRNRWTTDQASIDKRMYDPANGSGTCKNIKDAGITVFTVLVMAGNSTLLQNCASPDSSEPQGPKYFALNSANQITDAFTVIGTALTKLRIAH